MMTTLRLAVTVPRLLPALLTALVLGGALVQAAPQASRQTAGSFSRADATTIANRLYRAMFGREGEPNGISQATAEIQRGNLQRQVNAMVGSAEFRGVTSRLQPAAMLEQFYRGLMGREPDTAGVNAYLPRMEKRQYASVLLDIIGSPEFRRGLGAPTAAPAAPTRLEAALDCQARVLDAARREASGLVFWSFDRMPEVSSDGRTASGPAVDRFDEDRPLTYRCDGNDVTFAYADRGRARGADRRLEFPSGAARACMAAARDDAGRAITFDAAALSATDTRAEFVIGLAANTSMRFTCEMEGTRVVSIHKRP